MDGLKFCLFIIRHRLEISVEKGAIGISCSHRLPILDLAELNKFRTTRTV
jgi:hypothetical protein